jgi:hypothetical protein
MATRRFEIVKRHRTAVAFGSVVGIVAACSPGESVASQGTWQVDCVAVLGTPTISAQIPLSAVPYSGVPRDGLIGDLSDEQLGAFCDFIICLAGGYRANCCTESYCPPTVPGAPPSGQFRAESPPLIAASMTTCFEASYGDANWPSREDCVSEYRSSFGECHVGLWEDCSREVAAAPLGLAVGNGPDCREVNSGCTGL